MFPTHLKEFVMNETLELEVVELGEAKEVTKGIHPPLSEDNPQLPYRQVL